MINIKVDEAYAFDMLSVLDIKKKNSPKDQCNFDTMSCDIEIQIGSKLFKQILNSNVYSQMITVNQIIYDLIDAIRKGNLHLDARVIDDANTDRFKIKQKLQSEFFLNELVENKIQN